MYTRTLAFFLIERSNFGAKEDGIFPEQRDKNRKQAHGVTTESDVYKRAMMNPNMTDSTTATVAVTRKESGPQYQVDFAYIKGERKKYAQGKKEKG